MVKGQRESAAASSEAASHFAAGRFPECAEVLQRLRDKSSTDTKVLANLAITEYLGSSQQGPHQLLEKLSSIKTLAEEQARAATIAEQQTASSPPTSPSEASQPEEPPCEAECQDTLLLINMAAVHLQLGEPSAAAALLRPLYKHLEPLDERQALRVCLLLLDCWLMLGRTGDAEGVVATISRATGLTETPQAEAPAAPGGPPPDVQVTVRAARARLAAAKADFAAAELELQAAAALDPQSPQVVAAEAQLHHLRGDDGRSAASLAEALGRLPEPADGAGRQGGARPALLGNLGGLHHRLGKRNMALLYYSKALREALGPGGSGQGGQEAQEAPPQPLPETQVAMLRYGTALQLLATGRHAEAAAMLLETKAVLYDSPLLWLRLAECCVQAHEQGGLDAGEEIRGSGEGGAAEQVIILGRARTRSAHRILLGSPSNGLSIEAAEGFLSNALFLLDSRQAKAAAAETPSKVDDAQASSSAPAIGAQPEGPAGSSSVQAQVQVPSAEEEPPVARPEFIPLQPPEQKVVRRAVLANLAYALLALGNPSAALRHTKLLLDLDPGPRYRMLACCYAAEAHCMLGDLQAAAGQMQSSLAASAELSTSPEGSASTAPKRLGGPQDRALLHVNLASVHAMRRDFEKAKESIAEAQRCDPTSRMAQMSAAYLMLLEGKRSEALKAIRVLQSAPRKPLAVP